jgi:hypothetical protein
MIPDNDTEKWLAIECNALESLRAAGGVWRGVGTFRQIFHFLIVPSLSAAAGYSFSDRGEPLDGTRYYCVRTKWDRRYDAERFESGMRSQMQLPPTVEQVLFRLTDEFAELVCAQIAEVSVPLFVQHNGQIDGTHYEFLSAHFKLNWGENVPKEWMPLAKMASEFAEHVETLECREDESCALDQPFRARCLVIPRVHQSSLTR